MLADIPFLLCMNNAMQCVPSYEASISPGNSDIVHHMEVILVNLLSITAHSMLALSHYFGGVFIDSSVVYHQIYKCMY